MSSGWFDHTEPSLSTSLQGKQGVQGATLLLVERAGCYTAASRTLSPNARKQQGPMGLATLSRYTVNSI